MDGSTVHKWIEHAKMRLWLVWTLIVVTTANAAKANQTNTTVNQTNMAMTRQTNADTAHQTNDASSSKVKVKSLFTWARENGAFIHECLEYRDYGMFLNCCVGENTTLVSIPGKLQLLHENTWESIRDNIVLRALYPLEHDTMFPYFDFLSVKCYSPMCRPDFLTSIGREYMERLFFNGESPSSMVKLAASTVYSRMWASPLNALIPIVDLFNHGFEKTAWSGYDENYTFSVSTDNMTYSSNEEVRLDYGFTDQNIAFWSFGIHPPDFEPSCLDFVIGRFEEPRSKRMSCLENTTYYTLEEVEYEIVQSQIVDDEDMVYALRRWIRNYWRSEDTNSLNPRW